MVSSTEELFIKRLLSADLVLKEGISEPKSATVLSSAASDVGHRVAIRTYEETGCSRREPGAPGLLRPPGWFRVGVVARRGWRQDIGW